jgi:hypothetical protein
MINNVAVNDPITADTMNAVIDNINGSPNRVVIVANTVWSVPVGVTNFKVFLAGGGGGGGNVGSVGIGEGETMQTPGGDGGDAPMISCVFTGAAEGQNYPITIGAAGGAAAGTNAGAGTATSFGTMSSSGGAAGSNGGASTTPPLKGNPGTAAFPVGVLGAVYHDNGVFGSGYVARRMRGFGSGGDGAQPGIAATAGRPGAVIIEW